MDLLAPGSEIAVVDLGSNSFHLQIVRASAGGELLTVERIKDKVQLLAGFEDGKLAAESIARALVSLARLGQRVRSFPPERLCVIGTSALRQADNSEQVLAGVRRELGVDAEVISGDHEARLIYTGVSHHLAGSNTSRLVIDIGGGSTEFALGSGPLVERSVSREVGCVELTDRFFRDASRIPERFPEARAFARERLAEPLTGFEPPDHVYGTSGTVESVLNVLQARSGQRESIDRAGLDELIAAIVSRQTLLDMGMPGLAPERIDIFPAGVALVAAIFDVLGLDTLEYLPVSLQDGALYDLLARPPERDVRQPAVEDLQRRYAVDVVHAARVRDTALALHSQIAVAWGVDTPEHARMLGWAAELCQLGLAVGVRGFHRHGGYIISNTELRGFTKPQRKALALLVRSHRRRMPSLAFAEFSEERAEQLRRLSVLLRLAVIMHRGRVVQAPAAQLTGSLDAATLRVPASWLDEHALSRSELDIEQTVLAEVGVTLSVQAV